MEYVIFRRERGGDASVVPAHSVDLRIDRNGKVTLGALGETIEINYEVGGKIQVAQNFEQAIVAANCMATSTI